MKTREKYLYSVTMEHMDSPETGPYLTYSIVLTQHGKVLNRISDVSLNRKDAESIADKLNRNDVSPEHFFDVVQDEVDRLAAALV